MDMLFTGETFLVSTAVGATTVALLQRGGAAVVYLNIDSVTCAIVADGEVHLQQALPDVTRLKARRVPILYESWVHASVAAVARGSCPPPKHGRRVAAHDPLLFGGLEFTTTQLPRQIKLNVIAAMQFYGAHYSPHLTTSTRLLVYCRLLDSVSHDTSAVTAAVATPRPPCKLDVARARGVPCVTVGWVQKCLSAGELLPPVAAPSPAATCVHTECATPFSEGGMSEEIAGMTQMRVALTRTHHATLQREWDYLDLERCVTQLLSQTSTPSARA